MTNSGLHVNCHFIIEVYRLNYYKETDYRLSHFQTTGGAEIDLILTRARETLLIEIKSTDKIDPTEVRRYARIAQAFKPE